MIRTTLTILSAGVVAATIGTASLTVPAAAAGPTVVFETGERTSVTLHYQSNLPTGSRLPGGNGNRAGIFQHGRDNSAGIGQNGRGNRGMIRQHGSGHSATLQQNGNHNGHVIMQYGRGGQVDVPQTGNGQIGATIQVSR